MNISVEIVLAILVCIATVITVVSNMRKNAREDGAEHGNIEQKLDNITTILNDVKRDMDDMKADARENRERIVRIETCNQHTEKRLDGLSEKVRRLERHIPIHEEVGK